MPGKETLKLNFSSGIHINLFQEHTTLAGEGGTGFEYITHHETTATAKIGAGVIFSGISFVESVVLHFC